MYLRKSTLKVICSYYACALASSAKMQVQVKGLFVYNSFLEIFIIMVIFYIMIEVIKFVVLTNNRVFSCTYI